MISLNQFSMSGIEKIWYQGGPGMIALLPAAWLFRGVVAFRRWLYRRGFLKINHFPVPLIVVGNITIGGTGKTPFVIWLVRHLRGAGYRPGIVSRGYRGKATAWPQMVTAESDPSRVGDEAVLLAQRCRCPVAVAPDRSAAVRMLLENGDCDIIISDDGMQHYAMGRDIEIVVVDGERRFGNGQLLPAGPLREPVDRLREVNLVIVNGGEVRSEESSLTVMGSYLYNLAEPSRRTEISRFGGQSVHAVAGIGHPERFFDLLRDNGIDVISHPFGDHHAFNADELVFGDDKAVLMTEKDAVKCAPFAMAHHWVVGIETAPDAQAIERLDGLLDEINVRVDERVRGSDFDG